MIKEELLAVLVCPKCKGPVVYVQEPALANQANQENLDCSHCRLRYRIQEDIPIMLIEEAKSY